MVVDVSAIRPRLMPSGKWHYLDEGDILAIVDNKDHSFGYAVVKHDVVHKKYMRIKRVKVEVELMESLND